MSCKDWWTVWWYVQRNKMNELCNDNTHLHVHTCMYNSWNISVWSLFLTSGFFLDVYIHTTCTGMYMYWYVPTQEVTCTCIWVNYK